MGEKSGGLTNKIIALVALVVIVAIIQVTFPDITETIVNKMRDVIQGGINDADGWVDG